MRQRWGYIFNEGYETLDSCDTSMGIGGDEHTTGDHYFGYGTEAARRNEPRYRFLLYGR
eukprot:SAG31_NODE_4652_length_3068_cov_1.871674_3_plen_59_part_00